jgi:phosphatidylserine decarboxylase
MTPRRFSCIDRRTGRQREDPIYAPRLLTWCYGTQIGRVVMDLLLIRPVVSTVYGWWQKRRCGRRRIARFCARMQVNLDEALGSIDDFPSVNALVTRDIDLRQRPVDRDPTACVAPVDGRYLVYPMIRASEKFEIKHLTFQLLSFLRDRKLAGDYDGGSMAVARLDLADYHHFHFPVDGIPAKPIFLGGGLHAVSPYPARRPVPAFAENRRTITTIETEGIGRIVMAEIGAFTIGSIKQVFVPGIQVAKGAHKGLFEFGASVVVLLFEPGAAVFDSDLVRNSAAGIETYIRLGEHIATSDRCHVQNGARLSSGVG